MMPINNVKRRENGVITDKIKMRTFTLHYQAIKTIQKQNVLHSIYKKM